VVLALFFAGCAVTSREPTGWAYVLHPTDRDPARSVPLAIVPTKRYCERVEQLMGPEDLEFVNETARVPFVTTCVPYFRPWQ
jgi:hypothetical protein